MYYDASVHEGSLRLENGKIGYSCTHGSAKTILKARKQRHRTELKAMHDESTVTTEVRSGVSIGPMYYIAAITRMMILGPSVERGFTL